MRVLVATGLQEWFSTLGARAMHEIFYLFSLRCVGIRVITIYKRKIATILK
jgi:hypothetical protein